MVNIPARGADSETEDAKARLGKVGVLVGFVFPSEHFGLIAS